jgi:hypothetical protein
MPQEFIIPGHVGELADAVLDLKEGLNIAPFIHREISHRQTADLAFSGRQVIGPGEMIRGACGEKVNLAACLRNTFRQAA